MSKYLEIVTRIVPSLQEGTSVRILAENNSISYGTLCSVMRRFSITNKGLLKDRIQYNEEFKEWLNYLASNFANIAEISKFFKISREKVSSIYSAAGVYIAWNLEDNHNELLAAARRAELFVKNLGYRVIRDCYTCEQASHQKAPYDLILERFGSVDVKSAPIKKDKYGNTYASFNTQNFTKGVKYAFCVALTEDRQDFVGVFAIPGKHVYGHSTIHITLNPLSKKYAENLIWKNEDFKVIKC